MFIFVLIGLLLISFLWALWALAKQNKIEEVKTVKKKLKQGRVVFHSESSDGDSSSSSKSR